ncbi:ubiquitin recognition factor in ER-associated degradation protein 1-like isoform X2 [Cimex lectularius]|uniref:Ubiquitin fusion degradation protein 1 homolog n=1 Tax=Cimex lectularius TaxID=79782 RepID=A0A8I6RYW5_CIMLE|nr:ubiquitin recognition factor in ER-associated degradation protein 1-like isoform X2 [Cimex lectularius]
MCGRRTMFTSCYTHRFYYEKFGFTAFLPRPFNMQYLCYSVAMIPGNERDDVERGGKIIMPPSALDHLTRLNISYPMLFRLTNNKENRTTHCGVLEFIADEGKVYLPNWMMHNLLLDEGDIIKIESIALPVATFSRFQPMSSEFLDISNPKAVLENCLRSFACLTAGDTINIKYNQKDYELSVLETQPGNAVSIIECDMNVEFAAPVGYQEPESSKEVSQQESENLMVDQTGFVMFGGTGYRLDGKDKRSDNGGTAKIPAKVGIPDYDWKFGTLTFIRNVKALPKEVKKDETKFLPFSGKGTTLSKPKS